MQNKTVKIAEYCQIFGNKNLVELEVIDDKITLQNYDGELENTKDKPNNLVDFRTYYADLPTLRHTSTHSV
jgi:hypothetical protein